MIRVVVFVLFWLTSFVYSQNEDQLFASGNSFYQKGKYQEAVQDYEKILNSGKMSSELYFNLGNCYYKLNQVALSVYYYEKALKLNSNNKDAANNLIYANKLTLDRIEPLPKSLSQKIDETFSKISVTTWALLAVSFSTIGSVLFLLYYFSEESRQKKIYFATSILSFLFLVVTFIITFFQFSDQKEAVYAIIFNKEVSVSNEPTKNGDEVFILHEGTKVKVIDSVDLWKKIKLIDGKIGWVKSELLKEI